MPDLSRRSLILSVPALLVAPAIGGCDFIDDFQRLPQKDQDNILGLVFTLIPPLIGFLAASLHD